MKFKKVFNNKKYIRKIEFKNLNQEEVVEILNSKGLL